MGVMTECFCIWLLVFFFIGAGAIGLSQFMKWLEEGVIEESKYSEAFPEGIDDREEE